MQAKALLHKALQSQTPEDFDDFEVNGISADSREIGEGFIFVAIKGTCQDGADFAEQAENSGAKLLITHKKIDSLTIPQIKIENPECALANLAWTLYGVDEIVTSGKIKLIGVTGTNGKTTSCLNIQHIFNESGKKCARFGTISYDTRNKSIVSTHTTPDAIKLAKLIKESFDNGADTIVLEASSHGLDQGRCHGLKFTSALFTNLSGEHLDYHQSMENYLHAKMLLFESLAAEGVGIVNADDPASKEILGLNLSHTITYAIENTDADLYADGIQLSANGTKFQVVYKHHTCPVTTTHIGKHNVYNTLGAIGVGLSFGFSLEDITMTIADMPAAPGRLERVENNRGIEVFVDYAHTDDGLRNVLETLKPLARNGLTLVFGCGGDRDKTKRPRMAGVAERYCDKIIVTSDNPRTENPDGIISDIMAGFSHATKPKVIIEPDRREAISVAVSEAVQDEMILVAGKGHEDYQIIGTEKIHFDDRECVRELTKD